MAIHPLTAEEIQRQADYAKENRDLVGEHKKYYILTFGCQLNDHDSEKMGGLLEASGYTKAEAMEDADIVILNTCSIRENADTRFYGNLGHVRSLQKARPDLIIGVCGCMMMQTHHVETIRRSYPYVDLLFGTSDIYRLPELLNRRLRGSRRVYDIGSEDIIDEELPVRRERKHRALVTIMYGCNNFCAYCVVPYTRGRERSRDPEKILRELKQLGDEGYGEVMLLGQNVNTYGQDLTRRGLPSMSFAELLERAATESGIPRIRFMTSHPKDISSELLDVIAAHANIERHLHLPVQSGSDRVLARMNRKYTAEAYLKIVEEARAKIPGIQFSTDIIVGFPGETEEDFVDTLKLVETVRYQSAFTFQYSPRRGTPAAKGELLSDEVMTERFGRLLDVQNRIGRAIAEEQVGKRMILLTEGLSEHHGERYTGRSSENFLVNYDLADDVLREAGRENLVGASPAAIGEALEGAFVECLITEAKTFSLRGRALRILPAEAKGGMT